MVVIVAGNLRPRFHFGTLAQRNSFFVPVLQVSAGCCSQTHSLVSDFQTSQRSSLKLSLWFWYTIQDEIHGVQLNPLINSISQGGESQMRYYESLINVAWFYDQLLNLYSKVKVTLRLLKSQSLLQLNPGSKMMGSGPVLWGIAARAPGNSRSSNVSLPQKDPESRKPSQPEIKADGFVLSEIKP